MTPAERVALDVAAVQGDVRRALACLQGGDSTGATYALQRALADILSHMNQRRMVVYWRDYERDRADRT